MFPHYERTRKSARGDPERWVISEKKNLWDLWDVTLLYVREGHIARAGKFKKEQRKGGKS